MLLKRFITALVLIPLLLLILLKGVPLAFTLLVLLISIAGMIEYFRITSSILTNYSQTQTPQKQFQDHNQDLLNNDDLLNKDDRLNKDDLLNKGHAQDSVLFKAKFIAYIISALIISAAHANSLSMILLVLTLNLMAMSLVAVLEFKSSPSILDCVAEQIQGVVYIPLFLSFLVLLRNSPNGAHWVVWLWIVIGLSDTGAYYVGSNFGKNPLAKHVSPKKTVEGALGGIGTAALGGVVYGLIFIDEVSFPVSLLFSIVAAVSGQLGDLFESALKRVGGIKDSGTMLPGHGGILDRIDGLIFAAPVAYLFKVFII
ncbi:MAG: phosphatidate cytidylyltransferase [Desulfamplus sp.]|nr:phosphatidate cytidylyltransferase [Desulfamplus sp.]